jgi:ubiquinone/menaquinone biosynthesis C-methylase UbiE
MSPQEPNGGEDERLRREREFHDTRFTEHDQGVRPAGRFYAVTGASGHAYSDLVASIEPPAHVLELGCGLQAAAWDLLARGVEVTAIDISGVAVEAAARRARELDFDRGEFLEMNAEDLHFDDGAFDAVVGSGILHHLDIGRGTAEAARVLKPGGRFILVEPMGHNPVVNLYRRYTPDQRTEDEHPLLMADFEAMGHHFEEVRTHFFHFLSLGSLALSRTSRFEDSLHALERADQWTFRRLPWTRRMAWMVVVEAVGPKAPARA